MNSTFLNGRRLETGVPGGDPAGRRAAVRRRRPPLRGPVGLLDLDDPPRPGPRRRARSRPGPRRARASSTVGDLLLAISLPL